MALAAGIEVLSEVLLPPFLDAAREYGVPVRVRGDHGVENLLVAAWMEAHVASEQGRSYIWGRHVSLYSYM